MGREARAIAAWRGQTAQVKALLESHEIVLRGGIRARIPRSDVTAVATVGGRLDLLAAGEPLVLTLGEPEAGKWAAALLRPPPSLADKLGVFHYEAGLRGRRVRTTPRRMVRLPEESVEV